MTKTDLRLIDEKNKAIVFSNHIYLPEMVMAGSIFSYLKTISNLKVLLIISKTVYTNIKDKIKEVISINDEHVFIFKGEPTPEILKLCKSKIGGSDYDCVLGIGGGSVIDLAKVIKKEKDISMVAVPTTPATGSEATPYSVLTDNQNNKKTILSSRELLPSVVILDASLLETIGTELLGYSIMDIMAHSLEALVSKRSNLLSDSFALESIRLVLENYLHIKRPYDKGILEKILMAGFLGGLAQGMAAVGLAHGLAHYFGAEGNIPHSRAISIFLEPVLQLNLSKCDKYNKLDSLKTTNKENILDDIAKIKQYFRLDEGQIEIGEGFDEKEAVNSIKRDICSLTNPIMPNDDELIEILNKTVIKK